MPADQMRSATACTIQACAFTQCFDDARMRGQAKIVVAAKRQHCATIDLQLRRARRLGGAAAAKYTLRIELRQLLLQSVDQLAHAAITLPNTVCTRTSIPSLASTTGTASCRARVC